MHALHIYNKKWGGGTIDTLSMGGDSDTWWKTVGNELGRLANDIDNWVKATNTIKFIRKEESPKGCTLT